MRKTEKQAIADQLRIYADSKESRNAAAKTLRGVSAATLSQKITIQAIILGTVTIPLAGIFPAECTRTFSYIFCKTPANKTPITIRKIILLSRYAERRRVPPCATNIFLT